MRVLLLVDCYLPSTKSSARLIADLAAQMHGLGHEVMVAAPDDQVTGQRTVDHEDGVTVLRIRSGRIKGASRLLRGLNERRLPRRFWSAGGGVLRDFDADLIVFYSPSIFWPNLVARLKRRWGCPAYMILRDIFPQWAVDAGVLRHGSLPHRYFRRKELQQYRLADVIGVQSPANRDYFDDPANRPRGTLEVLFNWMPTDDVEIPRTRFREQLGLTGKVVFFYGGNIGVAQDMDNVMRLAAAMLHRPDVHFLLVGDGSEVPRLEKLVGDQGLHNVTIHDPLEQRTYQGMLAEFDVGLLTLDRKLRTQNFPGKMLTYMFARMPILASINPGNDLKDVLEEHDAGLVLLNGDDDGLVEAATRLADDAGLRRRTGDNGRALLESRFSAAGAARQILQHARRS